MHDISLGGFGLALAVLAVIWLFLPENTRLPLAFLLVVGALAWTGNPSEIIKHLTGYLK